MTGGGDIIAMLSARVSELSKRVALLAAELESAQRRVAIYEEHDATIQDAVSGALRAAYTIRQQAETTAEQILEQAREERRLILKDIERLQEERDRLEDEIAAQRRSGLAALGAMPLASDAAMQELRSVANDALRGIFKEIVDDVRATRTPPREVEETPHQEPTLIEEEDVMTSPVDTRAAEAERAAELERAALVQHAAMERANAEREAAEARAEEERAAAQRASEERAAIEARAAEQRAAALRATEERAAAEARAAEERAATERAAEERAMIEARAAADRAAEERAAQERAAAEARTAAEQAAIERAAAERAAAERAAAERTAAERAAEERAAEERAAAEARTTAERAAAERAVAEARLISERSAAERAAAERAAQRAAADQRAAQERAAAEQAAAERAARERAAAERAAAERAAAERAAAERAAAERAAATPPPAPRPPLEVLRPTAPERDIAPARVEAASPTSDIQLVLTPIPSFPRLVEIERQIQALPNVRTLYVRDFRGGTATLAVQLRSSITPEEFATLLSGLREPRLRLVAGSRNTLELRVEGEAGVA